MAKVDVFNLKREKVGEVELADEVFAAEVKEQLFHEVVVAQLASRRRGHPRHQGAVCSRGHQSQDLQAEGHW